MRILKSSNDRRVVGRQVDVGAEAHQRRHGVDVAGGDVGIVDLSKPVLVAVATGAATPPGARVRLSICPLGRCVIEREAPLTTGAGGVPTASIDMGATRYVVAGRTTARVEVVGTTGSTGPSDFSLASTQPCYQTAGGVATVALGLFAGAYVESCSRSLRRSRRRGAPVVGAVIASAVLGGTLAVLGTMVAGAELTTATLVAGLGLGLAAGAMVVRASV